MEDDRRVAEDPENPDIDLTFPDLAHCTGRIHSGGTLYNEPT